VTAVRTAAAPDGHRGRAGLALAVASVFASAFLLFAVQPMVARMLLPRFGGSPAVWNTALLFYQTVLLAGYAYAHWSVRRLGWRRQMALHTVVLLIPLAVLPPWPRLIPGTAGVWPVAAVLAALAGAVLLPFFALSTNASLTQRWFALARGDAGPDPYRLYAVSNAGSLLALAAYPFVVEPLVGTRAQALAWSAGYVVFVVLSLAVMAWTRRRGVGGTPAEWTEIGQVAEAPSAAVAVVDTGVSRARRLRWLVWSAVPTSLLMSATLVITTDVVALPLLWVVPLGLYLVTYILAFAWPNRLPRRILAVLAAAAVAVALVVLLLQLALAPLVLVIVALAPLVFGGLVCHLDLARDRPDPAHLTEFYLWLAVGGVVGGVLNSLVAPVVFSSVAEYPLTLAVLAWLLPMGGPAAVVAETRRAVARGGWLPAATMTVLVLLATWRLPLGGPFIRVLWLLGALLVLPYALLFRPRAVHFALAATLLAGLAVTGRNSITPMLAQARSFFGVVRVLEAADRRVMMHGTTIHGAQLRDPALRSVPPAYYHPRGPLGALVADQAPGANIGLVGLGTGALAALTKPGQTVRVFEIDPLVEAMARRYFSYLADAPARVAVTIADGRLGLAGEPDGSYNLLVMDAFTGDAVPTHLLTAEALDLVRRKLRPDGVAVFHVSNRSLDLVRVFRGWAARTGHAVAVQRWEPDATARRQGATTTLAVAVAADDAVVRRLVAESAGAWQLLDTAGPAVVWTDDFTSLVGVLGAPTVGENRP
jgi:spermidine synthase